MTVPPAPPDKARAFKLRVARNLRRLRSGRGLSLEQASARTSVSKAMLSQVETGKTTPTISVIWKIATGLGFPFAELLGDEQPRSLTVKRREELPTIRSEDSHFRSTPLVGPHMGQLGIEAYRISIDAGQGSRSSPHPPGTVELVVVQRGRLKLTVGEREEELGQGDVATFTADVEHAYAAVGRGSCLFYDVLRYHEAGLDGVEAPEDTRAERPTAPQPKPRARKPPRRT